MTIDFNKPIQNSSRKCVIELDEKSRYRVIVGPQPATPSPWTPTGVVLLRDDGCWQNIYDGHWNSAPFYENVPEPVYRYANVYNGVGLGGQWRYSLAECDRGALLGTTDRVGVMKETTMGKTPPNYQFIPLSELNSPS